MACSPYPMISHIPFLLTLSQSNQPVEGAAKSIKEELWSLVQSINSTVY
jgi:hypothetical protein